MRRFGLCSLFVAVSPTMLPTMALAAEATAAPVIAGLPFEQLVTLLASVAVPLFLGIGGWLWKDSAKQKEAKVAQWIKAAYLITEEVSKLTPNKVDDKVAFALGALTEQLKAAGITPTLAIADQAKATWTAMSGAEKVEASVRAKAVALAAEKVPASEPAARPQMPLAGS